MDEATEWVAALDILLDRFRRDTGFPYVQNGSDHCGWCEYASLCEVTPTLRQLRIKNDFQVREITGQLLSGADE